MKNTQEDAQVAIANALKIAAERHGREFRKGGARNPYLLHPLQVVDRLGHWGLTWQADPLIIPAAILHDVLEDVTVFESEYWAARIKFEVGHRVLMVVEELTFFWDLDSEVPMKEQKAEYLRTFAAKSVAALSVKVADRLCNVMDFFSAGDVKYAATYFGKAKEVFDALVAREAEFDAGVYRAMMDDVEWVRRSVSAA